MIGMWRILAQLSFLNDIGYLSALRQCVEKSLSPVRVLNSSAKTGQDLGCFCVLLFKFPKLVQYDSMGNYCLLLSWRIAHTETIYLVRRTVWLIKRMATTHPLLLLFKRPCKQAAHITILCTWMICTAYVKFVLTSTKTLANTVGKCYHLARWGTHF